MITWKAIYSDGSELPQYNADGSENKYLDIQREKLSQFIMLDGNKTVVVLHLDKGKRLICRKRVRMNADGSIRDFIWLAGWQETVNERNVGVICVIFQDGHLEVVEKLYEGHPLFYPIELTEQEK